MPDERPIPPPGASGGLTGVEIRLDALLAELQRLRQALERPDPPPAPPAGVAPIRERPKRGA